MMVAALTATLRAAHPYLSAPHAARLIRAYGTDAARMLEGTRSLEDLGLDFGATLYEVEVQWLVEKEYARTAADVVWRRSKLGLRLTEGQVAALDSYMAGESA